MAETDVVGKLSWTSRPKDFRNKAPYVWARAKQLKGSQLKETIDGYMSLVKGRKSADEFYENLYETTKIDDYKFPYFNDNFRQFTNDYADTLTNITDRGQATMGASMVKGGEEVIANIFGMVDMVRQIQGTFKETANPGSYIETPKFYQFANTDQPLQVQFPLLNTINAEDAKENADFIKEFIRINRPHRENAIAMSFPAVYEVEVPGLRFIKWAYLSDLSFSLLGTRHMNDDGKLTPEGYMVSMTFNSLTVEVDNFLAKL